MKTSVIASEARLNVLQSGLTVPKVLTRHAAAVAEYLRSSAPSPASFTGKMAAYHMGWRDRDGRPAGSQPGKLVRPALCLWACEACGGQASDALPVAAALEWMHNFTLIHDDIQDGDRERRNRETVWSVWGMPQGINAGDALHALAFRTLAADGAHPARRLEAIRVIADAALVVIEGQTLDLQLEGKPETSLRTYLSMVRSKTGALIGASLEAGAATAGAQAHVASGLRKAGVLLGTAFQIRDDWLGTWGDSAATGKSANGDLGRCKLTYPVVAGYGRMREDQRARMRSLFCDPADGAAPVRTLLQEVGGSQLTAAAPRQFADRAVAIVQELGLQSTFIDDFSEVAYYVAHRAR